ncbi:MAG: ankyrin repeat domain-containing protein [Pararhodobacter sp.]|nr:ankyrin repeat domain-containing protein [Pararhodobacter sp.]
MQDHWKNWQQNWRWMEGVAQRRGWDVAPLAIAPPATKAEIARIEAGYGMTLPEQLRQVFGLSARVSFGWSVPSHLMPIENDGLPNMSTHHDSVWDITHVADHALPSFLGWKDVLSHQDLSEVPNTPQMWDNQFAFCVLANGDMLTIDMSDPDPTCQPVRYFSYNLEILHGRALAPDFISFITVMSKLGHAGSEWHSMMLFGADEGEGKFTLSAEGPGAARWLAWLKSDPARAHRDKPPPVVVESTAADRALLDAARAHCTDGVIAALADGAQPDCVYSVDFRMKNMLGGDEFFTAISYAVRHDDVALVDRLLQAGATLDTRHLPLNVAASEGSAEMMEWLIARGARVSRWQGQRHDPLYDLVQKRGTYAKYTLETYLRQQQQAERARLLTQLAHAEQIGDETLQKRYHAALAVVEQGDPRFRAIAETLFARHVDHPTYLRMLDALLTAGADPNALGDHGATALYVCDAGAAKVLLRHGARAIHRAVTGWTPLHYARDPEKLRILVEHGADVNDLAEPTDTEPIPRTPVQDALSLGHVAKAHVLLDLGADPRKADGAGFPTQAYCLNSETFALFEPYGFDPLAPLPNGDTLLHNLLRRRGSPPRASWPDEVAFLDHLLALGIDINDRDAQGQTVLHLAVVRLELDFLADIELLLARGADSTLRDNDGKRAVDRLPRKFRKVRAALRATSQGHNTKS